MDTDELFDKYAYEQPKRWKFVGLNSSSYLYNAHLVRSPKSCELFANVKQEDLKDYTQWFGRITAKNGQSGRAVLLSAFGVNHTPSLPFYKPKTSTILFKPKIAVFQIFSDKEIDLKINNITGDLPGVEYWFEDNLVDYDRSKREFKNKKDIYSEVLLQDIGTATLRVDLDISNQRDKLEARNAPKIRLDFTKSFSYEQSIRHFKTIEDFFNFIYPSQTNQSRFSNYFERRNRKTNGWRQIISVPDIEGSRNAERSRYDALFRWSDVSDPQAIIANWFSKYGDIEKGFAQLKLIKNNPTMSEDLRFISLITGLEYIHRHHIKPSDQSVIDSHLQRLETIKAQLSDSSDRKLIKRLKTAYEPSLDERLRDVRKIADKLGLPAIDKTEFDKIAITRNNQIHSLNKKYPEILYEYELYRVNMHLARWLKLLILIMIGLSKTELESLVQSSTQFKSFYRD